MRLPRKKKNTIQTTTLQFRSLDIKTLPRTRVEITFGQVNFRFSNFHHFRLSIFFLGSIVQKKIYTPGHRGPHFQKLTRRPSSTWQYWHFDISFSLFDWGSNFRWNFDFLASKQSANKIVSLQKCIPPSRLMEFNEHLVKFRFSGLGTVNRLA